MVRFTRFVTIDDNGLFNWSLIGDRNEYIRYAEWMDSIVKVFTLSYICDAVLSLYGSLR